MYIHINFIVCSYDFDELIESVEIKINTMKETRNTSCMHAYYAFLIAMLACLGKSLSLIEFASSTEAEVTASSNGFLHDQCNIGLVSLPTCIAYIV